MDFKGDSSEFTSKKKRVLRPPGGGSSFSFGFDDPSEEAKPAPPKQNQQSSGGLVYGSSGAASTEAFQKQQDDIRTEQEANKKMHDTHSAIFGSETVEHRSGKAQGKAHVIHLLVRSNFHIYFIKH